MNIVPFRFHLVDKCSINNRFQFYHFISFCLCLLDIAILLNRIGGIKDHQFAVLIFLQRFGFRPVFFQGIKFAACRHLP